MSDAVKLRFLVEEALSALSGSAELAFEEIQTHQVFRSLTQLEPTLLRVYIMTFLRAQGGRRRRELEVQILTNGPLVDGEYFGDETVATVHDVEEFKPVLDQILRNLGAWARWLDCLIAAGKELPVDSLSPNDLRNEFIYNQIRDGASSKQLLESLKTECDKHDDWTVIRTSRGLKDAADRWAEKRSLDEKVRFS